MNDPRWRKSKPSNPNGACVEIGEWHTACSNGPNCVEAADYRKSTHSNSTNCVEVASGVLVRDTIDREGPVLSFTSDTWSKFTDQIKSA